MRGRTGPDGVGMARPSACGRTAAPNFRGLHREACFSLEQVLWLLNRAGACRLPKEDGACHSEAITYRTGDASLAQASFAVSTIRVPKRREVDVVASAVFAWCAERRIGLRTQAGVSAASAAISLFESGYRTQDALFHALHGLSGNDLAHFG